jgi:alkanesulfonate monooxygenase SsuD/methylene tetrahydromethanopterin reductase-like flavin-dependent oxidoreductase (luciferase family)
MKLGASIEIQEGLSYVDTLSLARAAEEHGYDAALLAEHYCASSGAHDRFAADAWVFLAALARDTRRIRLGTLVSPVTFRHPSVLAKLAASLDHLSEGRAELGLGAGWLEAEHDLYGFPFPSAKERVDLLEEQLQVIGGLWSQKVFSHDGPHYRLRECTFNPRPIQEPHPPLILGGRPTSRRLPRLAASYAQEYVVSLPTPDECQFVAQTLGGRCKLSVFTYACVAETAAGVDRVLRRTTAGLRPEMTRTERWIVGTQSAAREYLDAMATAGVSRVFVAVWDKSHHEMLQALAACNRSG